MFYLAPLLIPTTGQDDGCGFVHAVMLVQTTNECARQKQHVEDIYANQEQEVDENYLNTIRASAGELGVILNDAGLQMAFHEKLHCQMRNDSHPYLEESPVYQEAKAKYDRDGPMAPPYSNKSGLYQMARFYLNMVERGEWTMEDVYEDFAKPVYHPVRSKACLAGSWSSKRKELTDGWTNGQTDGKPTI